AARFTLLDVAWCRSLRKRSTLGHRLQHHRMHVLARADQIDRVRHADADVDRTAMGEIEDVARSIAVASENVPPRLRVRGSSGAIIEIRNDERRPISVPR